MLNNNRLNIFLNVLRNIRQTFHKNLKKKKNTNQIHQQERGSSPISLSLSLTKHIYKYSMTGHYDLAHDM